MSDRFKGLLYLPVWPHSETAMGILQYVTASGVPYHKLYEIGPFFLCGVEAVHPTQVIYLGHQL